MSYQHNTTVDLWGKFMPVSQNIRHRKGRQWYSVEVYPDSFFSVFNPVQTFEKWAAVAVVKSAPTLPEEMEELIIDEGDYAVFTYRGSSGDAHHMYRYIYSEWIPQSDFDLDNRPHFALMGPEYKKEDPDSQEELWIPIRKK
jgi:AraC family transcriptional regulator